MVAPLGRRKVHKVEDSRSVPVREAGRLIGGVYAASGGELRTYSTPLTMYAEPWQVPTSSPLPFP